MIKGKLTAIILSGDADDVLKALKEITNKEDHLVSTSVITELRTPAPEVPAEEIQPRTIAAEASAQTKKKTSRKGKGKKKEEPIPAAELPPSVPEQPAPQPITEPQQPSVGLFDNVLPAQAPAPQQPPPQPAQPTSAPTQDKRTLFLTEVKEKFYAYKEMGAGAALSEILKRNGETRLDFVPEEKMDIILEQFNYVIAELQKQKG